MPKQNRETPHDLARDTLRLERDYGCTVWAGEIPVHPLTEQALWRDGLISDRAHGQFQGRRARQQNNMAGALDRAGPGGLFGVAPLDCGKWKGVAVSLSTPRRHIFGSKNLPQSFAPLCAHTHAGIAHPALCARLSLWILRETTETPSALALPRAI